MHSHYGAVPPYQTRDGSQIRELMHPGVHGNRAQSLAEATIPGATRTLLHRHPRTEELYHIVSGSGWVWRDDHWIAVVPGDTLCISPGTVHCAQAAPAADLKILCCCSPAYSHDDTELLDAEIPAPVA